MKRIKSLKWTDSLIFGGRSWPIISRLALRLPAGEIVKIPLARERAFTLLLRVETGLLHLWFGPANPGEEQPDLAFARLTEPFQIRLEPGAYTLFVRAADGRSLEANLTAVGRSHG